VLDALGILARQCVAAATAADVVLAIASLGGHVKQNGRPGCQVVWGGFRKVTEGYRLVRRER